MNEEFQFKNWEYKDLGMLGAYIVEKNNESYKQIDVTNVKQYIKDLIEENKQLKGSLQTYEILLKVNIEENQKLKFQLEASEKARKKCSCRIKTLGKFDGEKCTRSLKLWVADFNELINILDIDKGK